MWYKKSGKYYLETKCNTKSPISEVDCLVASSEHESESAWKLYERYMTKYLYPSEVMSLPSLPVHFTS